MASVLVLHWGRTAAGPTLTLQLARHMLERDDHKIVVSFSGAADVAEQFRALPCPKLEVKTWNSAREVPRVLLNFPGTLLRLRRYMKQHDVRTVIVPMEHPLQSLAVDTFGRGVRYVHFMHDASLHPGEQSRVVAMLRRHHMQPADEVVVFSDDVRRRSVEEWNFNDANVHLARLPAMFAAPGASPEPRELPVGRPVRCGMFGRAIEYKGFDLAVEAVHLLRSTGRDVVLELTGAGVTQFVPEQYMGAPWLILQDRWLGDDEITSLVGSYDILLLPYKEASQSGVLVEAAALGVPVVTTPVGGLPEQVRQLGCGEVASTVSGTAVAAAVEHLLENPEVYLSASVRGIAAGSTEATWNALLDTLEPLIS